MRGRGGNSASRILRIFLLFGLFLCFRGYRSREGDQAYRLPLLLHQQADDVLACDPFISYFEVFNPHRGSLLLLDVASRPFGLSAGLAGLFVLTFLATGLGLDRLARDVWPDRPPSVGLIVPGLVFLAQAGNVGTNHLFEPLFLDRLLAFAMAWVAFSCGMRSTPQDQGTAAAAIGFAAFVHPSLGAQLAALISAGWVVWAGFGRYTGVSWSRAVPSVALMVASVVPGYVFNVGSSHALLDGLTSEDFWLLCVKLQSPQHMLPHLWRTQQWLAWACYPLLTWLSWAESRRNPSPESPEPRARVRLGLLLVVNLLGLSAAWFGIEVLKDLRLTVFQPFRLATVARGLCLVFLGGHLQSLWDRRTGAGRARVGLLVVGLVGDGALVVATLFEALMMAHDRFGKAIPARPGDGFRPPAWLALSALAAGLVFLARHDTESGHLWLVSGSLLAWSFGPRLDGWIARAGPRRLALRVALAWAFPVCGFGANAIPRAWLTWPGAETGRLALVRRYRIGEVAVDDLERLALWCRANTAPDARFIGPPGSKTFRLWARRALAFNRAGSPYHGRGLADWAARFREHVAFRGSNAELVDAYLRDRRALENRYDDFTPGQLAALAARQGAGFVLARSGLAGGSPSGEPPLEALATEGRYSIYRVAPARPSGPRGTGGLPPVARR